MIDYADLTKITTVTYADGREGTFIANDEKEVFLEDN